MEGEAWSCSWSSQSQTAFNNQDPDYRKLMVKTEMCRRFKRGMCRHGADCDYAHTFAELRTQPKLCRLFLHTGHCSYGRNCRYLHYSSKTTQHQPFPFPNPNPNSNSNSQLQLQPENKRMRTSATAPSDVNTCSEYRMMMQPSNAATNAPTGSSHKNEAPHAVKCIFKHNDIQKISRIYADWI